MSTSDIARLREQVHEQRAWMNEHGRDLAGYVKHYGSKHDPDHYGDGGEAIYEADLDELVKRVQRLIAVEIAHMQARKEKAHGAEKDAR
jgi:hypothetical protein